MPYIVGGFLSGVFADNVRSAGLMGGCSRKVASAMELTEQMKAENGEGSADHDGSGVQDLRSGLTAPCSLKIEDGEYWYGGCVMDGSRYPFTAGDDYRLDLIDLDSPNQVSPAFVSTHGRALWSEEPFDLKVQGDTMVMITRGTVHVDASGANLRDAQQNLARQTFTLGQMPPEEFFRMPQWNTWIELIYKQNQRDVMKYANGIVDNGFPPGIIMIDDFWGDYYGRWQFSPRKFPDPKGMVEKLHDMGFKVMVWVCPFVTPDTVEYHELRDRHMLIFDRDGEPVIRQWWNGYGAILDMSNPETYAWLKEGLQDLRSQTGVDGFKFDAGDFKYYHDDDASLMRLTRQEEAQLWGRFGTEFDYNEYRVNYKNGGLPLVNRLQDKIFEWGKDGLSELIPDTITQGLLGYYYNCPDMIGGGEYRSFLGTKTLDQELIVRSAQCAALMAMMQFSVAPWRVLDKEHLALCQEAAHLHVELSQTIVDLARKASQTGEPITRSMAYDFPQAPVDCLKTQFMLGDRILSAPVIEKGATSKRVYFPEGRWQSLQDESTVVDGPVTRDVPVTLATLPAYRRID